MIFTPRPYQVNAIDRAVDFFNDRDCYRHAYEILPTGSGKSVVIANTAKQLKGKTVVFQPSKEILKQNFAKFISYGYRAGIYSASAGFKYIDDITFATIGSVTKKHHLFSQFQNVIIDECFPYDQYISTEGGKMKIGRFVERFNAGLPMPKVYSYSELKNEMELKEVLAARCNGEKDLLQLSFSKNIKIKCTPNHPFLTLDGWKNAEKLSYGDCILTSSYNGTYAPIPNADQVDFILGSFLGDGSIDKTRRIVNINRFRFIHGLKQQEYIEWKQSLVGGKIRLVGKNGFAEKPAFAFATGVMYFKDEHCSKEYAIRNLNPKSLAISWMDDGHLYAAENGGTFWATATSKDLTLLLNKKLESFGIYGEVLYKASTTNPNPNYYIRLNKAAINVLCSLIAPYVHPSMQYKLVEQQRYKAGSYKWNNEYSKQGAAIMIGSKPCKSENVYNIQVEGNETYVITSQRYDKNQKVVNQGLIVHNCHLVNADDGMYKEFIASMRDAKVLGLTATPYRLAADFEGAQLKFLDSTSPRIFSKCLYYIQNNELFDAGHLAPLEYYRFQVIDRARLEMNKGGTDFTEESMRNYYKTINMPKVTIDYANRMLKKRNNLLVFCGLIAEANEVSKGIPGSVVLTGKTPQDERDRILAAFVTGAIRCVINVGVLTTGFDFPALEAVLMARSTMSLAIYYQIIGRIMRPFTYPDGSKKVGWFVDLGGNFDFFGKIETMKILEDEKGRLSIHNNGRRLTNVPFTKN